MGMVLVLFHCLVEGIFWTSQNGGFQIDFLGSYANIYMKPHDDVQIPS